MTAIFVPGVPGLTEQQLERLRTAGVTHSPFVMGDQSGRLFLDDEALGRVLGAPLTGPDRSSYDGVAIATFGEVPAARAPRTTAAPPLTPVPVVPTPSPAPPATRRVTLPHWHMDTDRYDRRIATESAVLKVAEEEWVAQMAEGLQVANYWGSLRQDIRTPPRGRWGVYLSAGRRLGRDVPDTLLGVQIPGGVDAIAVEQTSPLQVLADPSGFEYAQITGKRIWILLRFGQRGEPWEVDLFRAILREIVKELTATAEEKISREEQARQAKIPESRAAYVSACGRRVTKAIADTEAAITRQEGEVSRTSESLVRLIREVDGLRKKLPLIQGVSAQDIVGFGREFDKLMSLPKVKYVECAPDGSIFRVFTTLLHCIDPRSKLKHEIGEFKIEINANTSQVKWYNLTRRITGMEAGMQAPHVYAAGHACLGNTAETFPDLIARYELSVATMVAINFVESVNVQDAAGRHINKWPVAGTATVEELAAARVEGEEADDDADDDDRRDAEDAEDDADDADEGGATV